MGAHPKALQKHLLDKWDSFGMLVGSTTRWVPLRLWVQVHVDSSGGSTILEDSRVAITPGGITRMSLVQVAVPVVNGDAEGDDGVTRMTN